MKRLFLCLLGLVFATGSLAQDSTPQVTFTVDRYVVEGDNPLSAEETDAVLAAYVGEQSGPEGILAAADALTAAFQAKGLAFRRVVFPPQTLQGRTVRLEVVSFELATVTITGNEHSSDEAVLLSLPPLQIGAVPSTRDLARAMDLANDHPVRQVQVTFKESETANALDATVNVEESRPYRVYGAFTNDGTGTTNDLRLTLGGMYTNLFGRDVVGAASYTTSPGHAAEVKQWAFTGSAPLYNLGGRISALYVSSEVDSGTVLGGLFDVTGSGDFVMLGYSHFLPRQGKLSQRVFVRIEDKLFDNNVTFNGVNSATDLRSRPISVGYAMDYKTAGWSLDAEILYAHNLPGGRHNRDQAYEANRFGAERDWGALRMHGAVGHALTGGWSVRARAEGQYTTEALVPGEQFGAGGANSVRGFSTREVVGDYGLFASAELWAPPPRPELHFFGFVDAAYLRFNRPAPTVGQNLREKLLSVGIGSRWQIKDYASLAIDAAYVLSGASTQPDGSTGTGSGEGRIHFSLVGRY